MRECVLDVCDGSGTIPIDPKTKRRIPYGENRVGREYVLAMCRCRKFHELQRAFHWAKIPDEYAPDGFDGFDESAQPKAFAICKKWLDGMDQWIFMCGTVGTGKTHLAASMIRAAMKNGVPAVLVSVPNMLDILRPNQNNDNKRMKQILDVDVLGLDDLGAQRNTEWVTEQIFKIVDHRAMRKKTTIITSNMDLNGLVGLGAGWDRIADRIAEHAILIGMNSGSYRLKKSKQRMEKINK